MKWFSSYIQENDGFEWPKKGFSPSHSAIMETLLRLKKMLTKHWLWLIILILRFIDLRVKSLKPFFSAFAFKFQSTLFFIFESHKLSSTGKWRRWLLSGSFTFPLSFLFFLHNLNGFKIFSSSSSSFKQVVNLKLDEERFVKISCIYLLCLIPLSST